MNPIHSGKVEKGKQIFDNPHRYLVHTLKFEGKRFEIVLRAPKKQRSNPQNAYYWGVVIEILKTYLEGYTAEEIHEALKIKFASRHDPETGLVVVESTAGMDTKRFNEYFEAIKQWAAEFFDNCYIPDPNEAEYDEQMR